VLPILSALLPHWAALPSLNTGVQKSAPSFNPENLDPAAVVEVEQRPTSGAIFVLPVASKNSFHVHDWLPLVWMTGFALLVMRLAAAQWFLGRAGKRCIVVRDGRLAEAKQDAWQQLNIRRPVQLLLDPRRTIPMAWGVFRPRVLLPAKAADWDETRLHAVLLHEMAHIKRGDPVVQWLAQLSCALHWFNPLVWFAAWRLRVESERACDDLVLTNGVRASDYAKHLLHVATTLSPARMAQACGLAMACRSGFEGRLLAVLNQRANRRRVTRTSAFAALTLGLCVVVPVAMLRAASEKRPSDAAVEGRADIQKTTNEDHTITAVAAETDSVVPGTSTAKPPTTQPADAGNNEVNRVKLLHAESNLQRATALRAQNLISEVDFNRARTEVEIARAELAGCQDEVARIRLRDALTELDRMAGLQKANLASQEALNQAQYKVALLRAETNGDAAEAARVRLRQAEGELNRASQLRRQNLISETEYNDARQQVELRRAELGQADTERSSKKSPTDEMQTLLKARDEARAKAEAVELKMREAGKDPRLPLFSAARAERDKQVAAARDQSQRLLAYERYAEEAGNLERQLLRDIDVGKQSVGMQHLARYETLCAEVDLLRAKGRAPAIACPAAGQILVEARVIETPPNERVPDDPSNVTSGKGINVLSSSQTVTHNGEEAEIFIWKEQPAIAAPGATDFVRTGIILRVTPHFKEDQIAYTVRLPQRDLFHSQATDTQTINETSRDELQVSGTTKDGEGTWFHIHEYSGPPDRKIGVISVWLRFKRLG
jgi:beta-lactamase regulating signal transducer with metallopeptidase domain